MMESPGSSVASHIWQWMTWRIKVALQLGRGAKLAKLDITKAYHVVPIHLDDRCLLRMKWQG